VAQQETVLPKESEQKAGVLVPSINSASGVVQQPDNVHIKPHIAIIDQSQHVPLVPSIATAEKKPRHRARITLADTTNNTLDQKEAHQPADVAAESKSRRAAPAQISAAGNKLDKHTKQLSVQQQADNEFRKANGLMQQGHVDEAIIGYEAALRLDAGHDAARQVMVALLLEKKRNAEAEGVLEEGLKLNLKNSNFAMVLARLQVERDASWSALLTLQKSLPYASQQAEYQAFVAALLQRLNRHKEAVQHYQKALQLAPNTSVWLMGMGISLQAMQRKEEARDAFKRATELHTLSADLQEFVTRRLKEI
jgi:MSHA biogenesis protein MshN